MLYCNREHQAAHRPTHKVACNVVAKKRDIVEAEERKLRAHPGDMWMSADPFTNDAGCFWSITPTRDYMRARYALVKALGKVNTRDAVHAQLDHLLDMLHLCRGDNMGVRDLVPHLMLRLNKDQECYDFVNWWNTTANKSDYAWGDLDLPYLDIKNADVFESPAYLCYRHMKLSQTVAITLLKIKLLLDLTEVRDAIRDYYNLPGTEIPAEVVQNIQNHIPRSPTTTQLSKEELASFSRLEARIDTITAQVSMLYKAVNEANKYFWPALENPGHHLSAHPDAYSMGTVEEMQIVLPYCYDSWLETPGALEVIRRRVNTAGN